MRLSWYTTLVSKRQYVRRNFRHNISIPFTTTTSVISETSPKSLYIIRHCSLFWVAENEIGFCGIMFASFISLWAGLEMSRFFDAIKTLRSTESKKDTSSIQCSEFDVRTTFWSVWMRTWHFNHWFGRTVFGFEAVWTDRLTKLGKVSFGTWLMDRLDADVAFWKRSGRGRGILEKVWTGQEHGPKWTVANVRTDMVRNSEHCIDIRDEWRTQRVDLIRLSSTLHYRARSLFS